MLTLAHIERLTELESQVHYDELPPFEQNPFDVVHHDAHVLISAPHGAKSWRGAVWHEEDEFTAGMALLLAEVCLVPAIVLKWKSAEYDPNYTADDQIAYKQSTASLIEQYRVKYVIDLHGAAAKSETLDPEQTVDLGLRQKLPSDVPSMNEVHVNRLEELLGNIPDGCTPKDFIVRRNRFPAKGPGTITTFASSQDVRGAIIASKVQAIQIEMKPQLRVARRFTSASLYKTSGSYQADPSSLLHTLQSLVDFVEYLKSR